jgi:hypothetical protein
MVDTPESLLAKDKPCGDAAIVGLCRGMKRSLLVLTDVELEKRPGKYMYILHVNTF